MPEDFELLERFKPALRSSYTNRDFSLGSESGYNLYYVPFEIVNADACIALVGITPGPNQMSEAYVAAQAAIRDNLSNKDVLLRAKRVAAFAGMRPRINEMLDHFNIPSGSASPERLRYGVRTSIHSSQPP